MQHDLGYGQTVRRRVQDEACAGGMAVHRRRPPGLGDEGADVFDLALDRVRGRVAAVASAPTIVVKHGEMLRQLLRGRAHQSPVAHRSAHHDERRTIAQPVEGDRGAVFRSHLVHGPSFFLRPPGHGRLV